MEGRKTLKANGRTKKMVKLHTDCVGGGGVGVCACAHTCAHTLSALK